MVGISSLPIQRLGYHCAIPELNRQPLSGGIVACQVGKATDCSGNYPDGVFTGVVETCIRSVSKLAFTAPNGVSVVVVAVQQASLIFLPFGLFAQHASATSYPADFAFIEDVP